MVSRVDLHQDPSKRLAKIIAGQREGIANLATGPAGVKHLGDNGDIVWAGPEWVPDPSGGVMPGPSYTTWSVRDVPKITETLSHDLEQAEQVIADAQADIDSAKGDIAAAQADAAQARSDAADAVGLASTASLEAQGAWNEAVAAGTAASTAQSTASQAAADAAAAQSEASQAASEASQAASDAAQAADDAAAAAGKKHVLFSPSPPPGDPDALWIETGTGQPHQWTGSGWVAVTDSRITEAAAAASAAQSEAEAASAAASAAASSAQEALDNNRVRDGRRTDDDPPVWYAANYPRQHVWELKRRASLGWPGSGSFATLHTFSHWGDSSGGPITQELYTQNGDVYTRLSVGQYRPPDGDATWSEWQNKTADAQAAADAAQSTATTAMTAANGRNSIISDIVAASGSVHPLTGLPLIVGDIWNQWDSATTRVTIASWRWDGAEWQPQKIGDAYIDSLSVNKLVASVSHIDVAVVNQIVADIGFYEALYADSLTAEHFAAALADIIKVRVENLTVTEGAVINEAVVQKLAAAMITAQVIRTEVDPATGLYAIMDSFGFRVIDNDGGPEGTPLTLIALGPDENRYLQLGTGDNIVSIDSSGGVSARTISADQLFLGGRPITAQPMDGPRGIVSYGIFFGGYSRELTGRDSVLGLEASLAPGRVYKLCTSSVICSTQNATGVPFLQLHRTVDGSWPGNNWGASAVKESIIGPFGGFRALPGMEYWIDLTSWDPGGPMVPLRATLTLANQAAGTGWVRVSAPLDRTTMWVEDWGTRFTNRGHPYLAGGGGGDQTIEQEYTTRFTATGYRTYIRGGAQDTSSPLAQGQWSSWNRETVFFFPSMTSALAGATIHSIKLRSRFTHWGENVGTGSWCWHGETGMPASSPSTPHMVNTSGWTMGAAREISIIPQEFADWQSGVRRGFAFSTTNTSRQFYGKLSDNMADHWIEVRYTK